MVALLKKLQLAAELHGDTCRRRETDSEAIGSALDEDPVTTDQYFPTEALASGSLSTYLLK
jgi:hypothetical protein